MIVVNTTTSAPASKKAHAVEAPSRCNRSTDRGTRKSSTLVLDEALQALQKHRPSVNFEPIPHDHKLCEKVIINVSGLCFETQLRTLHQFPDTLLGDPERRIRYFDPIRNEYFFDRYRPAFEAILYYYQSGGCLRRPMNVPLDVFSEEVEFWELGEEATNRFRKEEGFIKEEEKELPSNLLQQKIWLLFEDPHSSKQAKWLAIISMGVIIVSIAAFCIETKPQFRRYNLVQLPDGMIQVKEDEVPYLGDPFFIIETMCIIWFIVEFMARFLSCPNKLKFSRDPMNLIDLMAILPFFFSLSTALAYDGEKVIPEQTGETSEEGSSLALLRLIRILRVFRIFKLARHSKGLRIIARTLRASSKELGLLVFFLSIGAVVFSSLAYFAEVDEDSQFRSIPHGCWWSVVTMTTVGYGDMAPIGTIGKLIGTMCVLCGVLTIALPAPFIESNFTYFYNLETRLEEMQSKNELHVSCCPDRPATLGHEKGISKSKTPSCGKEYKTEEKLQEEEEEETES